MHTPRLPVVDWTDAPRRFKWTRPFRRKTKSGFCACAITFQTQSTTTRCPSPQKEKRRGLVSPTRRSIQARGWTSTDRSVTTALPSATPHPVSKSSEDDSQSRHRFFLPPCKTYVVESKILHNSVHVLQSNTPVNILQSHVHVSVKLYLRKSGC
jgi:hypothetical protein